MRHLASVQKISNLTPIEKADRIELARILGWNVIVKKGEFNVGDKCVYVEIDSILPSDRPEFDFLKHKNGNMKPIKTIKMRGQISQGIAFPMSILDDDYDIGTDVTDILGVKKYEIDPMNVIDMKQKGKITRRFHGGLWNYIYRLPLPLFIKNKLYIKTRIQFPPFIHKTDETRVQVLQPLLDEYKGKRFYVTEKLDGQSVTIYFDMNGVMHVCSRNFELLDKNDDIWKTVLEMDIENKIKSNYPPKCLNGLVLQGEHIGAKIQGNPYKLTERKIFFFTIYDYLTKEYLDFTNLSQVLSNFMLPIVPVITTEYELSDDIDSIVKMGTIKSYLYDTYAEGIVLRKYDDTTVSFKAINPEYLLEHNV